jgi:hypothetical protein
MDKKILLASFIFPERIDWFLSYLEAKFGITKDKVFAYKNLDDESKVILTFKISTQEGKKINLKNLFPSAVPIHKKGTAMYTINALNKLIDQKLGEDIGNVDHKSYKLDWENYQDKIILIYEKELRIFNIARLF